MKDATEVTLEVILVSVINVVAVYFAAFTYKLNWVGVLSVMVIASLFTATVTNIILTKLMALKERTEAVITDTVGVLGVALISSVAVLLILTRRFNFPEALGISLLSGLLTTLIRSLIA
jgi:hypothetical protein